MPCPPDRHQRPAWEMGTARHAVPLHPRPQLWTAHMVSTALGDRLLIAKLRVPRADPAVPRTRLVQRVEQGLRRPVTVVAAPAGAGKSTLLSAWARSTGRAVAWLSLDEGDNDPVLFLTYLTAALGQAELGLGGGRRRIHA